jgi:hypothetical protein
MNKTRKEKEISKKIEKMFEGVNDDYLKAVLLVAYGGESQEILKFYEDDEKNFYNQKLQTLELDDPTKLVLTEEEKNKILETHEKEK